jgi:hypothetical protein
MRDLPDSGFVWGICEGQPCANHDKLRWRASQQYRCYKDSEETKREVADMWEPAAPPALDEDLANQTRNMEQMGRVELTRSERQNYGEEDKKSKANKLLSQVGPCLIVLSILPFLFLQ